MKDRRPLIYYGWIVLALAFVTMIVAYSVRYAFSVVYVAILDEYGWSRAATAAAFSLNMLLYGVCAPIVGALVDKYGIRKVVPLAAVFLGLIAAANSRIGTIWQLYLFFGMTAIGTCAMGYVAQVAMAPNWFIRRRGLAMGIISGGFGAAMAAIPPLTAYLTDIIGWRQTFLVFGIVSLAIIAPLVALFQRQRPSDKGLLPDGPSAPSGETARQPSYDPQSLVVDHKWAGTEWSLRNGIRSYRFWLFMLMEMFFGLYFYGLWVHQVAYLKDVGYTSLFAAGVAGMFGALYMTGSFMAFISDRFGREPTYTFASLAVVLGIGVLALVRDASQPWMPYLYIVLFGLFGGIAGPLPVVVGADLFQGKNYGAIIGLGTGFFTAGGAIGPWVAARIFDATGNYLAALPVLALSVVASIVCLWLAAPRKVRMVPGKLRHTAQRGR